MPRKKRPAPDFVGDLTDDWENRLAFIDGEFEEEAEAEPVVEETPELDRAERGRRRRRRKAVTPEATGRTFEQQRAKAQVTRELNKLVDASILKALPQIAVRLSMQARVTMKQASRYKSPYDIAVVAEYLRQTAATFNRVAQERNVAHFQVLLIDWLAENGSTVEELREALDLIAPTRSMLQSGRDSTNLVKLDRLKVEIRRRLSELQNK